ncbi:MAG: hypothetical protein DRH32_02370 [Deltaproteobacteria bacterium]|nr:MAG: hypothetical protein DRH32_02370 [Deltaproteobacteria bacterium]
MDRESVVKKVEDMLVAGEITPWKAEAAAADHGIPAPENITVGVEARRRFVEHKTGHSFHHLVMPDKPYHVAFRCPRDNTLWTLAAEDTDQHCSLCGSELSMLPEEERYKPLVNSYIGGVEDYCSYSGQVSVCGDVEKTFQILLCWGPGVGHMGIGAGCYKLNKYGPVEVCVSDWGRACRNLSFVFDTEEQREKARFLIQDNLDSIISQITQKHLSDWNGEIEYVDFLYKQHHRDRILHCCFYSRFDNHRGHGQTSHAVGMAKLIIDDLFRSNNIPCRLSVVGMGRDGDLKPSPRNRRGRYVSAQQAIPVAEYEKILGRSIRDFFSYIHLDYQGVTEETGWPAYTGMGGEIIPAFYRTMRCNPRPYLVSSYQKVYARIEGNDLVFGVELPNVEVGITSSPEGIIPPASREILKMWGIGTAKEFAAAVAAITLGGEFNFATRHVQEKMYTGK